MATGVTYRRAIRALADFFDYEPISDAEVAHSGGFDGLENAVFAHRLSVDPLDRQQAPRAAAAGR